MAEKKRSLEELLNLFTENVNDFIDYLVERLDQGNRPTVRKLMLSLTQSGLNELLAEIKVMYDLNTYNEFLELLVLSEVK